MLRMCRPIFGSWKSVVLDSVYCVSKCITDIEDKGFYAAALINNWCCCSKGVSDDLIDTKFEDKEVNDVGMIEARTEDNKLFKIFFTKKLYYVVKIMAICMTLDELEVTRTIRDLIDSSGKK